MTEKKKIDGDLRRIFRVYLPHFQWLPIETGMTAQGVPDSNFIARNYEKGKPPIEGWVEYKAGDGARGINVRMRPLQIGWIETRARQGGRVFVAVRRQCSYDKLTKQSNVDELYLLGPESVRLRSLQTLGKDFPPARGIWSGGPSGWSWKEIMEVLKAPLQ